MDESTVYMNVPSPSNSYHCFYGDRDHHLDTSHSDSHSSAASPYEMTFSRDLTGSSTLPSPDGRDADGGSETPATTPPATTTTQPKPTTKRRRENRYKNAPPSVLSRRRAQNRASQRAYRERKDQRIKDLEQMLSDAQTRNDVLSQAYTDLCTEYIKLKATPSSLGNQLLSGHHQPIPSSAATSSTYSELSRATTAADIGTRFVDTNFMAVLNAGNDLEAYLYPEVPGYHHL